MNVYDDSYRDTDPYLQPNLVLLPGLVHYHKAVISLVAQMAKSLHYNAETRVQSLGREDTLEKEMATHISVLTWRITWTRAGYHPWGCKESDKTK